MQILKALTPARILAVDEAIRAPARGIAQWARRGLSDMADRRRRQRATLGGTRTNEEEEVTWLDSRKRLRW